MVYLIDMPHIVSDGEFMEHFMCNALLPEVIVFVLINIDPLPTNNCMETHTEVSWLSSKYHINVVNFYI